MAAVLPDLIVSGLSVSASNAQAGSQITVNLTVQNTGAGSAGSSLARIRLASSSTISTSDPLLDSFTVQALSANQSASYSRTVTIPAGTAAGSYYMGVTANADSGVQESASGQNNNQRTTPLSVTASLPDLIISALSVTPTSAQAGNQVTVSYTVRNQGSGSAGSSLTRIRLATSSTISTSDPILDEFTVGALGSGQSQSVSRTVPINAGTSAGSYYMGVTANANSSVQESQAGQNNNQATTAFAVTSASPQLPDLVISALSLGASSVQAGTQVTVNVTVSNNGPGSAGSSLARIRLAAGTTITSSDPILDSFNVGALGVSQSLSYSRTVTIPSSTTAGSYYMGATANADSAVQESAAGQNNNQRTNPLTVTSQPSQSGPRISSVDPNPVTGSTAAQPFTIYGSNFVASSTVTLVDVTTGVTYANRAISSRSSTQIVINPKFGTEAHTWSVQVFNPGSLASNVYQFAVVTPSTFVPTITGISPNPVTGSNAQLPITIIGTNFLDKPTIKLTWTGQSNYTVPSAQVTFVDSTHLKMAITTGTTADNWTVTVINPDNKASNTANFQVAAPGAAPDLAVSSAVTASPNPATAGSPVAISFTIRNLTAYSANASTTKLQILDSANAVLVQGTFQTPSIPGNSSYAASYPLTLPSNATGLCGAYVILDNTNTAGQAHTNDANDQANGSFTTNASNSGYSLSGLVYDKQLGQKLPGAVISLGGAAVTADSNGRYIFTGLSNASYALTASKGGYTTYSTSVNPAAASALNIPLTADATAVGSGILSGYVRDASTGTPMPNVTVMLSTGARAVSNGSGLYTFSALAAGYYSITASVSGFLAYNQTVHVFGDTDWPVQLAKSQATYGTNTHSPYSNDPVNTATGNYTYSQTDLKLPGTGLPFVFTRNYNAQDTSTGPFGFGWSHSFNSSLSVDASGNYSFRGGDGKTEAFALNAQTGGYVAQAGVFDAFVANADGTHSVIKKEQVSYNFNLAGQLASIVDKNGNAILLAYTGSNLTRITDTAGRNIDLAYDASNRITRLTDPLGRTLQYGYDANGNLISCVDKNGNVTRYTYDANHEMLTGVDPRGNTFVSNVYDSGGRVVASQKDAKGGQTTFSYDPANLKTTVTQPLGRVTVDYYDELQRLVRQDDALGQTTRYTYDAAGNRIAVTDKNGNNTFYSYDERGNVTQKIDASNSAAVIVTAITYDALNNPLSRVDPLGNTTVFAYDAKGNLISTADPSGGVTVVSYDSRGRPLSTTNPNGKTTNFTYDAAGNLVQVVDPLTNKTLFSYDAAGRKLSQIDALNRTVSTTYDNNDNVLSTTNASGKTSWFTYDENNNRLTSKDFRSNTTTYSYDAKDLLLTVKDAANVVVTNNYDALDRKTSVTNGRGFTTQYGYDLEGNLIQVTDALGNIIRYTYDPNGNRVGLLDALNRQTSTSYDALNRVTSTTDAAAHTTQYSYDLAGRRVSATDANGHSTGFSYDNSGRLAGVVDANGGTVLYTYDPVGNRTSITDPNQHTTSLMYDEDNRLTRRMEPGGTYVYSYDAVGNRNTVTDPKNQVTRYSYDENNRLSAIAYPAGPGVTFLYDENGNRTRMTDALGATVYVYDALNRLTSVTDAYGKAVGYTYDENGNRRTLIYPGNKAVAYGYDALDRLASVTDWLAHTTSYSYDAASCPVTTVNPNGTRAQYGFDAANRLTTLGNARADSSIISSYAYTLDSVGNHMRVDQTEPLDAAPVPANSAYSYDSDNRLVSSEGVAQGFDANGNLTDIGGGNTLAYDYENRLSSASLGGTAYQYAYDGVGNRKSRIVGGETRKYVLDLGKSLSQVLADTDANGVITSYYIYGNGLISRIDADNSAYYYHYDSRGSTVAMTDANASIVNKYAYDPFGRLLNYEINLLDEFTYLGRHGVVDDHVGFLYIRARYYSTKRGRFITKDPTTGNDNDSQSLNRYVYALNNPVRLIDINGFSPLEGGIALNQGTSDRRHALLLEIENNNRAQLAIDLQNINLDKWITIVQGVHDAAGSAFSLASGDIGGAIAGIFNQGAGAAEAWGAPQGVTSFLKGASVGASYLSAESALGRISSVLEGGAYLSGILAPNSRLSRGLSSASTILELTDSLHTVGSAIHDIQGLGGITQKGQMTFGDALFQQSKPDFINAGYKLFSTPYDIFNTWNP